MQFLKHIIEYESKNEWFSIIPIGDIHLGNAGCDTKYLKDLIEWIANKENTFWLGMGDYIDAINYTDPRFDPKTVLKKYLEQGDIDKIIQMQIEDLIDLLEPIKDKCLGLLRGNHEEIIRKHYHYDVVYEIVKDLDLDRNLNLYDLANIRLAFKRKVNSKAQPTHIFDIIAAHGNVGGRTYGYKANRISDLKKYFIADIYLLAHSHIKLAQISNLLYFDRRGNQKKKKIIEAYTGCFLRGYKKNRTSYIEKAIFPPTDIGVVKILIQPETGDKHVSL